MGLSVYPCLDLNLIWNDFLNFQIQLNHIKQRICFVLLWWWFLIILKVSFKRETILLAPNTFICTYSIAACTFHLTKTLNTYHLLGSETNFSRVDKHKKTIRLSNSGVIIILIRFDFNWKAVRCYMLNSFGSIMNSTIESSLKSHMISNIVVTSCLEFYF